MNPSSIPFKLLVAWVCVAALAPVTARACDFKTMHFENNLPRPDNVVVSGAQPGQVVLFCTSMSAGCKTMREHLHKIGLAYLDKDIVNDKQACAEFDALGGQGVPFVVFNQRLMHGYYPSSFDRLYAQYHSGSALPLPAAAAPVARAAAVSATATPVSAPAVVKPAVAQAARRHPSATLSPQVEEIAPADFTAYIQKHPNVVVQFTSADFECGFCVDGSFEEFNDAAASPARPNVRFARVKWSPWQDFPKGFVPITDGGIPSQVLFKDGQLKGRAKGTLNSPPMRKYFYTLLDKHFGVPP